DAVKRAVRTVGEETCEVVSEYLACADVRNVDANQVDVLFEDVKEAVAETVGDRLEPVFLLNVSEACKRAMDGVAAARAYVSHSQVGLFSRQYAQEIWVSLQVPSDIESSVKQCRQPIVSMER